MSDLFIETNILNEIQKHSAEIYPHECCGVLLGTTTNGSKNVESILPLHNEFNDSNGSTNNRYLISPNAYKLTEETAQKNGHEILGFYHSHPDAPAQPSEYDRDHAWPWYAYIIVSVQQGEPKELFAWQLEEDRSKFKTIAILNSKNGE